MVSQQLKTTPINPRYGVQIHDIQLADILIGGVPWSYDEARSLSSICIGVTGKDGLAGMQG